MSGFEGGSAVLHSCYQCPTRYLPAKAVVSSFLEKDARQRQVQYRAFKFTQAICEDIQAVNAIGVKPTLISVGLDGWACSERMILPWLRNCQLEFEFMLYLNGMHFGLSREFAKLHHGVYWVSYDTKQILGALQQDPGHERKYDELIAAWKSCQDVKDIAFRKSVGRNVVNFAASFTAVE
jgi:hypothetical protein